jgi:hypothetical protein
VPAGYAGHVPRGIPRLPRYRRKFTVDQVILALQEAKGMTTVAARILHCDLKTLEKMARDFPQVAEVKRQERESMLDTGELSLLRAVQNGEAWAVCFLLKTQGKMRGYIERAEISGPDGGAIGVEVSSLTDDQRAERISGLLDLARERAKRTNGRVASGVDSATG